MIPFPSPLLTLANLPVADGTMQPFEHLLDFKTFASLRRMVAHQQSKPLVKRADFMKIVTLYLPEVAARIEESDFGIVHLEVGALKLATKEAIAGRDYATVRRHLLMIADLFDRADAELYDAIRISYLEGLFLDETSTAYMEARSMLSRPMENILRQSELHLERTRSTAA
ncbi:DUF7674 family protein [Sideroxydans lithotrophicus]|uniref:DUF7674 domain-containing protein n=1 Tax=Sideroxydans lithotrophicus (strain ES-1) TaxID=580332 RepID=D5CRQ1_SIDLE|nr:hypothetical protein [Sideroxydans lithotrophicus]ADE11637.1 hypothetical protein Slit_1400 [Sideroxydans lithotrophicus ES-1]